MQRKYSTKFKTHTIEKVLHRSEHQTIADIAMITGVNLFTLKEWLKLHRRKNTPQVKPSDEISVAKLHEEIQFLKKDGSTHETHKKFPLRNV
jgi:transposase-like protein